MPIAASYTTCSLNNTPNLGRFVAGLEVVPPQNKASNHGTYRLQCGCGISRIINDIYTIPVPQTNIRYNHNFLKNLNPKSYLLLFLSRPSTVLESLGGVTGKYNYKLYKCNIPSNKNCDFYRLCQKSQVSLLSDLSVKCQQF